MAAKFCSVIPRTVVVGLAKAFEPKTEFRRPCIKVGQSARPGLCHPNTSESAAGDITPSGSRPPAAAQSA